MADLRVRTAIKIVDPTTNANEAAVDASGNLQVILAANSGVDIGDVDVLSLPNLNETLIDDAAFTVATSRVFPHGAMFDDVATDSVDEGDIGVLRMSANRNLYMQIRDAAGNERGVNVDAGNNMQAILAANDGVDIGDVTLNGAPTGASAIEIQGTAADGAAAVGDPLQMGGVDGAGNMQRITTDTDGHLQVDVLSGGGTDTPTSPVTDDTTSAALAAGSTAALDSTDYGAVTKKLAGVDVTASVPFKAQILAVDNNVEQTGAGDPVVIVFGVANQVVQWRPPHRDYFQYAFTANAGFDGYRVNVTNMDNSQAADVYATFYAEN